MTEMVGFPARDTVSLHIYTSYDQTFEGFPAKNTMFLPYINGSGPTYIHVITFLRLAMLKTLGSCTAKPTRTERTPGVM
jgi:hypothetical protein